MTATKGKRGTGSAPTRRGGASEIAAGVFVGGWKDAEQFTGALVCVLDDPPAQPLPGMAHIPIYEESGDRVIPANLDRVAELAKAARARGEPVLLFCGHGVRRGSLAGAWYLHRSERIPLATAYERVRTARPQIETLEQWVGHPENVARE